MSPGAKLLLFGNGFNPSALPNNAAIYSLNGAESDSTYITNGSGRVTLCADRSGNSAVKGLVMNGGTGGGGSVPDSVALSITGDIDIQMFVAARTYTPATAMGLVAKFASVGNNKSYEIYIDTDGKLKISYSLLGVTGIAVASPSALGYAAFTPKWLRVTRVALSGLCTFYDSDDGASWNSLGTNTGTLGNIFDSTARVTIGATEDGGTLLFNFDGIIYRSRIYNGIAGTLVLDANFTAVAKLATSFTESSSNAATVTVNTSGDIGARISGARDMVQLTTAKMPALSVVSGYNTATFDGANDYLQAAAFSLNQPESVYLVMSQVSWTLNDTFCSGNVAGTLNIGQSPTTPNIILYAGTAAAQNGGLTVGTKGVLRAVFNGSASSLGVNLTAATTGNPGAANGGGFTVGWSNVGSESANMTLTEVWIRSTADDTTTQLKIAAFLIKRWGIAV